MFSIGTCKGESVLKTFCDIDLKDNGTASLELLDFMLELLLIIFLRDTTVLFDLFLG